ncbi:transmembrane protein 272-like isoform X2 [Dermacentor albipictus]|uniref:transmembrane protein 272-like isoform X2 n=2 Tax=Dermacentor albipictus TaxID=60249 RepID=UPI0038FD18F3
MYRSKDNLLQNATGIGGEPIDLAAAMHYGSTINAPAPPASRFWFGNDESVLERLRQAREDYPDHDPKEVAAAIVTLCLNHILFTLVVLATFLVPAASLIIGALTVHECPRQPMVPVLLVLSGVLALANCVGNVVVRSGRLHPADCGDQQDGRKFLLLGAVTALLNVALFAVFIAGCVYVYGSLWPSQDRASADYCSPTAFYFAFWLHTGTFIFLALLFVIGLLGMLSRCR